MQKCMAPMRAKWFYRHLCALAGCINMIVLMAVNLASLLCRLLALWLFTVTTNVLSINHACFVETEAAIALCASYCLHNMQ